MTGVSFARPAVLWLLITVPILVFLMWRGIVRRRRTLERFGVSRTSRINLRSRIIALAAVVCVVLALAKPEIRAGAGGTAAADRNGDGQLVETVFLLDVSRSMFADDVKPNRLERAKQVIADFAARRPGDRMALVAFAGSQSVACPLTADTVFFRELLQRTGPESVSRGGTRIGDAIRFALRSLFDELAQDRKQLVVLTDGGDHEEGMALEDAASEAQSQGIQITFAGVGSELHESVVPASLSDSTPVEYDGKVVRTHLEGLILRRLATFAGGVFRNVSEANLEVERTAAQTRLAPIGMVLAALAFALLLAEALASKWLPPRAIVIGFTAALALLLDSPVRLNADQESAYAWARQGSESYMAGRYSEAAEFYKSALKVAPGRADLLYNLACSLYRDNRFDEALAAFAKAQATVPPGSELELKCRKSRADALYQKASDEPPGIAEFMIGTALREYRDILKLQPGNEDAEFNAGVAERALDSYKRFADSQHDRRRPHTAKGSAPLDEASGVTGAQGLGSAGGRAAVEQDW